MSHPKFFKDANNIIIADDGFCYYNCTGNSYMDKLKNGLKLDYVFDLATNSIMLIDYESDKDCTSETENSKCDIIEVADYYEEYADAYEYEEIKLYPILRRGKNKLILDKNIRNMKKNCVKTDGYSYKLFIREVNLPNMSNQLDNNNYKYEDSNSYNDFEDDSYYTIDFENISIDWSYN